MEKIRFWKCVCRFLRNSCEECLFEQSQSLSYKSTKYKFYAIVGKSVKHCVNKMSAQFVKDECSDASASLIESKVILCL